ncbi:MAG TPA: choice-of-anchor D domain-containing protein [Candidatus Kapabacteria bacterium]|nr:choice-of-anchor D domain-containing protein [Candidatus Kapabacteria bacterium]
MKFTIIYTFILLILVTSNVWAQDTLSSKLSSYEGLNFLVGFMENEATTADPMKLLEQKIFITSTKNANVEITYGTQYPPTKIQVPANEVIDIDVSPSLENTISEVVRKSLIEIKSDVPISVYCFSSIPRSSDSYTAIPIANWGKEYRIVSVANDQYNKITLDSLRDLTPRSSQFLIMAAYDNTSISITPKALTRGIMQVDKTYGVILNKGECYLVQSWQYARGQGDLSGTIIKSTRPIGVLSGHVRTAIMQGFVEQPPDSKDHLIEMLPPLESWGKNYITVPFGTSPNKGDYFKVIAKDVGTKIEIISENGTEQINFTGNETVKVVTGLNKPAQWIATAPILLTQFMSRFNDTLESDYYDPSMVVIPPIEQFVSKVILQAPTEVFQYADGEKFNNHYINLVADSSTLSTLKIDNIFINSVTNIEKQTILGTNLHWAKVPIGRGKHIIKCDTGRFSGILYGVGRFDSYAMALGSSLHNPFTDDKTPPQLSYQDSCDCINGKITDEISENSYGIYYAYVRNDLSNNYNVSFSPFAPDMTQILFTACPNDLKKDANLSIEYMDKNGNTELFEYKYYAKNIKYDDKIVLGSINSKDSVCFDYTITNNGESEQTLYMANIIGDTRLKLYNNTFPIKLAPKESITLQICVNGKLDTTALKANLSLDFGCQTKDTIPIHGSFLSIDLVAIPYDFGDVMLNNTRCDFIKLINNSNISIRVDSLSYNLGIQPFDFDTLGIFPRIFNAGDTIIVPVCFIPTDRKAYYLDVTFYTEYSIKVNSYVKGNGVAPLVNSIVIDWHKRRVGTINDSIATFYNLGNADAILNFKSFINKKEDDNNSTIIANIKALSIKEKDSTTINLSYQPSTIGTYLLESDFNINFHDAPQLKLTLKGIGTLPIINTTNVKFSDIEVYNTKDTLATVITNTGNETLTIDSIIPISGDSSSFIIDYSKLKDLKIDENGSYTLPIKFIPTKVGNHTLLLEATHDANPNYKRSTSIIEISGQASEPSTTDIDISIVTNNNLVCLLDTVIIKIKNNSINNVDITQLRINKATNIIKADLIDFAPYLLAPNEEIAYKAIIYTEKDKGGKIEFVVTLFNNIEKQLEFDFYPLVNKLKVELDNNITYSAGDTVIVTLNGNYPNKTDRLVNFYLKIDIKNDYLYLVDYPNSVEIIDDRGVSQIIPLLANKTANYIELYSDEIVKLDAPSDWSMNLKFIGLLSTNKDSVWNVNFSSDRCFDEANQNLNTKLNDLCVFNVRHIQLITNKFLANIYPNPISDKINLKVVMPDADDINIEIFDESGEKVMNNKVFPLKKGIHFVSLDFGDVPNGIYFLKVRKQDIINNLKFIKIK